MQLCISYLIGVMTSNVCVQNSVDPDQLASKEAS